MSLLENVKLISNTEYHVDQGNTEVQWLVLLDHSKRVPG